MNEHASVTRVLRVWPALLRALREFPTIRGKLVAVMVMTTGTALLVTGIFLSIYALNSFRSSWRADLGTEASILALSTGPALAFDDQQVATRNLAALQARPEIAVAALYDSHGNLYAQFRRSGENFPATRLTLSGTRITGRAVEFTQPLVWNGEQLGTLYLRAHYEVGPRLLAYSGIIVLAAALGMTIALLLATALQRVVTEPLDEIVRVAQQVQSGRDYSTRARPSTQDELAVVIDAVNSMLDEIQARTLAQERGNAALKESERLYRAIGESMNYGVWVCDAAGRNTYASESFLKLVGLTLAQYKDPSWSSVIDPVDRAAISAAWQECVRRGGTWYREHRVKGVDGRFHEILAQGVPIRNESGVITGWAGFHLDIHRLKDTETQLREANRRKDEFLATLAHELRNPLAPIRHATRFLQATGVSDEKRQWGREVIARQVDRMALLLDDLLEVSRITRGRLELSRSNVSLDQLVTQAVETARPLLDSKRHTLSIDLPPEPVELHVDPLRASQALGNVLTNAAKYTDAGGHIELSASVDGLSLTLAVRDSGIGLTGESIPGLFEMFSQVDAISERTEGGLGIGLALVKGLMDLHGGSVTAASEGLGHGSTFTLRFPGVVLAGPSSKPADTGLQPVNTSRAHARVLVVDDNQDAADSLVQLLALARHEVAVAYSGQQALELSRERKPQVMILDIGMPFPDGHEVARRVREQDWGRRALLVAVTGWGQEADRAKTRDSGFDHHLTKPIDIDELERLIDDFMSAPAQQRQRL
jgi:PAS domain S-box-containing protein